MQKSQVDGEDQIQEADNEDSNDEMMIEVDPDDLQAIEEEKYLEAHPEELIFKEVLSEVCPDSESMNFKLENMPRPRIRPLIRLLMHEYQQYLCSSDDITIDDVFE